VSDVRRRELERRSRASGAAVDAARLLRERLRQGELRTSRLRLAALLGHRPSRLALDQPPDAPPARLAERVAELARQDAPTRARAALALARVGADAARQEDATDPRPLDAVAALARWVDCPCPDCAGRVWETLEPLETACAEHGGAVRGWRRAWRAADACEAVLMALGVVEGEPRAPLRALELLVRAEVEPARVGAALEAELVPWLLGAVESGGVTG